MCFRGNTKWCLSDDDESDKFCPIWACRPKTEVETYGILKFIEMWLFGNKLCPTYEGCARFIHWWKEEKSWRENNSLSFCLVSKATGPDVAGGLCLHTTGERANLAFAYGQKKRVLKLGFDSRLLWYGHCSPKPKWLNSLISLKKKRNPN